MIEFDVCVLSMFIITNLCAYLCISNVDVSIKGRRSWDTACV